MQLSVRPFLVLLTAIWISVSGAGAFAADMFYSVQVSAFQSQEKADQEVKNLTDKGMDAFSRYEDTGTKGMWYRIFVGRFAEKNQAASQAQSMMDKGLIDDYTIRLLVPAGEEAVVSSPQVASGQKPQPEANPGIQPEPLFPAANMNRTVPTETKVTPSTSTPVGFEIIVDLSGSTREQFGCSGYTKQEGQFTVLRKMNPKIPQLSYVAALRQFAYKRAWSRKDYTNLLYGPKPYEAKAFSLALSLLTPSDAITPLGWAISASKEDLEIMNGKKALIIFSDFKSNNDFGEPLNQSQALAFKYGEDLSIFTVYFTGVNEEIRLANQIAEISHGGKAYDGCRLLTDDGYFNQMIMDIFGVPEVIEEPVCPDEDRDTVCDDRDQCPNTPLGAPVDERGCWIAAYSQFFDFDKAEVKEQFLPRLKAAADIIQNNPHLNVVITGHTDSKGSEKYNEKLGLKRAEAVREWLIKFGVPAAKLQVESFGETKPIADNESEEGRAKNRRVEFNVWEPGAKN